MYFQNKKLVRREVLFHILLIFSVPGLIGSWSLRSSSAFHCCARACQVASGKLHSTLLGEEEGERPVTWYYY